MDTRYTSFFFLSIFVIFMSLSIRASTAKNNATPSLNISRSIDFENNRSTIMTRKNKLISDDDKVFVKSPKPESPSPRKWITQVFVEAAEKFDMSVNVTAKCKRDFELYKMYLQNQTLWAVRMLESSQWPFMGVFSGMLDHLGNYDECLWVNSHGVKGQYCLVQATYNYEVDNLFDSKTSGSLELIDEMKPAWSVLKMYLKNPVRVNRHKLTWAVCIPTSCEPNDLNNSLDSLLKPLFEKHQMNISVNVNPIMCQKKELPTYTTGYHIVRLLNWTIFALVLSSTIFEIKYKDYLIKEKNKPAILSLFQCFSLRKNWRNLFKYDKKKDLAIPHLFKIVNIMLIIYGHRYIYFIGFAKFSAEIVEMFYRASSIELVHTNVVDVFFMISGFLTFHFSLENMKKGGVIYLIFSIIFRWIRLVPVFGLLMLFIVNILPHLSDAPFWKYRLQNEVENCRASWWANLLVINNIVSTDKQCLLVSWYISADIQLTIIAGVLMLIICKNRNIGAIASVLTFFGGTATTFIVAYMNKYYGLLRLYISLLEEPRNSIEFTKFYISTYTRLGPYLVGFIAAFIVHILRQKNYKFSVTQLWIFFVGSVIIGEGSQYYGIMFYSFGREYYRIESATYAALNRSLFVFPYAVTLCMYFTSGLSRVGDILQQRFLIPLGRLTYSVFLVNTLLQLYHASSQKAVMPSSVVMNFYWWAASDILFSYIFGMLLYLFAEAPVCNISKLLQMALLNFASQKTQSCSRPIQKVATTDTNDIKTEKIIQGEVLNSKKWETQEEKSCCHRCPDGLFLANRIESSRC